MSQIKIANNFLSNLCDDRGSEEFRKLCQKVIELGTYVDKLERGVVDKASQGYVVDLVVQSAAMIGKHAQAIILWFVILETTAGTPPPMAMGHFHKPCSGHSHVHHAS